MASTIGGLPSSSHGSDEVFYVMVAGPGGSGKSPFIKEALGPCALDTPTVSNDPYPPAKSNIVPFEVPVGVIDGLPHNCRVVLVEVPALRMGTPADDIQIMADTVAWLRARNATAAGVVYLNETNPAKYGVGSMDARKQLPRLRSWFERLLSPADIPTKQMKSHGGLNVVVAIVDYRTDFKSALQEHWAPIVGHADTTESARRLVLGADQGLWTMESAHSVLRRLDLALYEVNGDAPTSSSNSGARTARAQTRTTPEPSGNCFERVFGWCG